METLPYSIEFLKKQYQSPIDFLRQCVHHRLDCLLYTSYPKGNDTIRISDQDMKSLHVSFKNSTARNILHNKECCTLLDVCKEKGVQVIFLKGSIFAHRYYAHPGERPSDDIDLLVKKSDKSMVIEILLEQDFKPIRYGGDVYKRYGDIDIAIDLHSDLWYEDEDAVWNDAQSCTIDRREFSVLSPVDEFLFLIAHRRIKHAGKCLLWIEDMIRLIKKESIDWYVVLSKAEENQLSAALYHECIVINRIAPNLIPHDCVEQLAIRAKQQYFVNWLCKKTDHNPNKVYTTLLYAWTTPGNALVHMRNLWRALFPTMQFISERYDAVTPKEKFYYACVYRPLYMCIIGVRLLFRGK